MAETPQTKTRKQQGVNNTTMPITDIVFMTLRHWPWIILSLAVCMGLAYFYILRTPNVYSRSAEIIIKDDTKGSSNAMDEFADFGLFQSNTNIANEMATIKSKDLMEEVVNRLSLDVSYYKKGTFHNSVVYGQDLPVKVAVAGFPKEGSYSFTVKIDAAGNVTVDNLKSGNEDFGEKQFKGRLGSLIQSPIGKIAVIQTPAFKKGENIDLMISKIPVSAARNSLSGRLSVGMSDEKGTILKLTLSDPSTQLADEVLTALIEVYNESWIRDKNQIAVSTSNFINDRLNVIEGELGNVDSDISSYKSANLVPDVQTASSMYMTQSQQTASEILDLSTQLQMARYIRSYLTSSGAQSQLLPANTGIANANIESEIADYNTKLLERNALAEKSSDQNPLVKTLDEQLKDQRKSIVGAVDNQITSLNTQLKGLQNSEAQTISRIASNPTQAKYLLSVERQQKVKESLYLYLLQKREENELSQAFTAYNTRIVNKPGDAGMPPLPNKRNIMMIAFLIGLFIPFGVTYVREMGNTKVRGRKDVENLTVPFLGEIPESGRGKKKDGDSDSEKVILVKEGKRDVLNESFRVLRTNLEFMKASADGACIIAVTSFNPGSGKSFITMNLSKTLSLKGKRVLVIDGDMRHGSASAYVNSPSSGLSDYLNGTNTDLSKLIVPVEGSDKLYILPVGTIPPNPAELLESNVFESLLSKLRNDFDYVMIDCPPIEVVADAQIIDKFVDRTIFIIRAGLLERSMLPELDRLYEQKKYKNMTFILNATSNNQGRYGYSHGYRYGYGYGYGYGYNYGQNKSKK